MGIHTIIRQMGILLKSEGILNKAIRQCVSAEMLWLGIEKALN